MANDARLEEPMSDERLAEIRVRWVYRNDATDHYRHNTEWAENIAADEGELLAEVERLRAREAALVAVVEIVANAGIHEDDTGNYLLLDAPLELSENARALLASE